MTELFVIGPPKTGTTLITRLVYQHPDILGISESYILMPDHPASICQPGKAAVHGLTPGDAEQFHVSIRDGHFGPAMCAAWEFMAAQLDPHQENEPEVFADSWPLYGIHLPETREAFPDARYLHTVRHPCAVYWSGATYMDRKIGAMSVYDLVKVDRLVRESGIPDDRLEILRYEDVVVGADATTRFVWGWLGLDPDAGWINYDAERDPWPERWSWIPNATLNPDPSRLDRWRKEMPSDERERLSRHPDVLAFCDRYGYEL